MANESSHHIKNSPKLVNYLKLLSQGFHNHIYKMSYSDLKIKGDILAGTHVLQDIYSVYFFL